MNERVLSLLVQNALNATRTVQQPDEVGLEPEVLVVSGARFSARTEVAVTELSPGGVRSGP